MRTTPATTLGLALMLGGCFLVPLSPDRPDPAGASGPAVYVEACESCHAARARGQGAPGRHAALGIRCGQCHLPRGHPDFARPVSDGTCAGCHQAEYQQTLMSGHFAARQPHALDGDRAARAAVRAVGFVAVEGAGRRFVGDATAGAMGGRLCAACHYDEHRLGLGAVRRAGFCAGCHSGREAHYPGGEAGVANRCVSCHVRVGETVHGQVVNSHRFARP